MPKRIFWFILLGGILIGVGIYFFWQFRSPSSRTVRLREWLSNSQAHPEWAVHAGQPCQPGAPFLLPTDGLIGYLWDDSFRPGHRHSGLDIFGGTEPGVVPVVAAYSGYLTRQPEWKSAIIIRVPRDPMEPSRQIWLYYTHMADPSGNSFISEDFPPGTSESFVKAGTIIGYQGNYTGNPSSPTGVHLHFSIVLSDNTGNYLNELEIGNTLDPSPYFGIPLNAKTAPEGVIICGEEE
jgi:peptidoglycan LD-endopeptidase LytH